MAAPESLHVAGKFFRADGRKVFLKGLSYGPFAPNSEGEPWPERKQARADFARIRRLGGNCVRVYFPPPLWLLDAAHSEQLRVFVDVPWDKHRCFFEDWDARQTAVRRVRGAARELGDHPALFAISVVNEIPVDVVRFYGERRVARFVDELLDAAKQEAPQCLTTFVNFPTTEFLQPSGGDFCCFNVYVHDPSRLGGYLDRLQHIAGNRPLVLGEYGIDSIREGEGRQAALLGNHLDQVFRRGLAGSFVFSYTDDWFTGGHQIDDWAFGLVRRDRSEKPAAAAVQRLWSELPRPPAADLPKTSVVVCCYNGGATLRECLDSLSRLDYPDYEVILVDDGSSDATPAIAADFPQVIYHRQDNQGLSVARNVGAELATGEIVAYTDSDCVADEHWLKYLVQAMQDQGVQAIGGPNIPPPDDGWTARCVAASPGNPSHVMLDDQHAEHVPGCNMAFDRGVLLQMGGFDPQFRQAGDDVDLCWRLLDAGLSIGYAPAAMVWHHRRATVKAYAKQQKGYGRSEAMVHFKHPQRCGLFARSRWRGIIYGDGAVGLPLRSPLIYHGRFGSGLFQTIYRHNEFGLWACLMSLEWHLAALYLLVLAMLWPPLAAPALVMWLATAAMAVRASLKAPLPRRGPWWRRPLVAVLYVMQPIWRGWTRMTYLLRNKRLPGPMQLPPIGESMRVKPIASGVQDLYWDNSDHVGRGALLNQLVARAREASWSGDFDNAWADWDIKLVGDCWHDITIRTATEELGWPRRFTRARCTVHPTRFRGVAAGAVLIWNALALLTLTPWALWVGAAGAAWLLVRIGASRRNCLKAAARLCAQAGVRAGLATASGDEPNLSEEPLPPHEPWVEPARPALEPFAAAGRLPLAARKTGKT